MNCAIPITISHHSSVEDRQLALRQIYQQVLERQPYESEHKILAKAEKNFLGEKIGVKRFLKELGHSDVYLNVFYHPYSNIQFLEGCFKHFLGRTPLTSEEIRFYGNILTNRGVIAMITALLDSEEYRKAFGCFTVPHLRMQKYYESPRAYMASRSLNHPMSGQYANTTLPFYWQPENLNDDTYRRHPEADEQIESNMSENEVAKLLKLLEAERTSSQLSPKQEALLRRAMR